MLAHGFVSPDLFIAVTILYDRYNTRLVQYYRGVGVQMPLLVYCFLLLLILAYLKLWLYRRVFMFVCAFDYNVILGVLALCGGVLSVVYSE